VCVCVCADDSVTHAHEGNSFIQDLSVWCRAIAVYFIHNEDGKTRGCVFWGGRGSCEFR